MTVLVAIRKELDGKYSVLTNTKYTYGYKLRGYDSEQSARRAIWSKSKSMALMTIVSESALLEDVTKNGYR